MAKLTREQKIEIYERRLQGETIPSLCMNFKMSRTRVQYLIRLISKHGYDILRDGKRPLTYSEDFKIAAVRRVLFYGASINNLSIELGLASMSILSAWVQKYKEICYNIEEKPKRRSSAVAEKKNQKSKVIKKAKVEKPKKTVKKETMTELSQEERIKKLEEKNAYLQAENDYLKKLEALTLEKKFQKKLKQKQ